MEVKTKEMAKTFGSLVGTLGKRFLKKRDRGGSSRSTQQKKTKKRKGHKQGHGSNREEHPNKKLKFMKPSD